MQSTSKAQLFYLQINPRIFPVAVIMANLWLGTIAPPAPALTPNTQIQGNRQEPIQDYFPDPAPNYLLAQRIRSQRISVSNTTPNLIQSNVVFGDRDIYILSATARQNLTVNLRSEQLNARFTIIAPNGSTIASSTNSWIGSLRETGDYQIVVTSTRAVATYTLQITLQ
ncbi:MAG: hypothetical protein HC916_10840 [Coleofasciculaceae cyanobacterium SM2_1_6]|nr:hypothetical protein [Coleofasciculaceae cyanobacterium SM2_1_6]